MATGRKKLPIWLFFTVAEDSRFAKCNKFEAKVPRGGQSAKLFSPTNLVHHLKTNREHEEEYKKHNDSSEVTKLLYMALFLDPRFKHYKDDDKKKLKRQ